MNGRRRAVVSMGLGLVMLASPITHPHTARAEGPGGPAATETTPEASAAALAHYAKGRELYQAGSYREAIVEFDAARALDPHAKQLVFNLAIVHEKLGDVDDALRYAKLYGQMDLEPEERTRAEAYIKRLEGARTEVRATVPPVPGTGPSDGSAAAPVRGRLDAATIAVGVLAVGAAGAGAVLGVKALSDKVSNAATGPGTTYQDEKNQESSAHSEAVVADICFGGAIVAGAVATILYFGRYRDPQPATAATPSPTSFFVVSPLVGRSAGGLLLGGAF